MKHLQHPRGPEKAAADRGTRVSYILILATWGTYLLVGLISAYYHDWKTVLTVGAGGVLLAVPFWMFQSGHIRAGKIFLMVIVLASVAAIATVGQGIRDLSIVAFPIVFIYVGLTSDRTMLRLCGGLTFVAILWLALGESFGWFVPAPFFHEPFNIFYLFALTVILAILLLAVDMLSLNMRRNLEQAQVEIQERRKTEEALSEKTRLLAGIYENVTEIIFDLGVEGEEKFHFRSFNPAFLKATGLAASQVTGKPVNEVIPEPSLQLALSKYKEAIRGRQSVRWEEESPYPSGTRVGEVTVTPVYDESGICTSLVGTVYDITDRKRAEDALRESENRFALSMEATRDGLWDWDIRTDKGYFSPGYYRMLGYETGEFPSEGKAWTDLIHPEDRGRALAVNMDCIEGRCDMFEVEYRMKARNGEWRWVLGRGKCVSHDGQGRALRLLGTHADITSRKQAEHERAILEEQLAQSRNMESVGRLAGGVAHDFNNMLGVILGHSEMALTEVDAAHPLRAGLEEIRTAAGRSADLTRQLLAFARRQTIAPRVLDLNEAVEGTLAKLRSLIGAAIRLEWLPQEGLWPTRADPSQIDQVLPNLCANAREAIAGAGWIRIETANSSFDKAHCAAHPEAMPGEYVLLRVSDNGCGMDKETLSQLFEPFFTTKGVAEGAGLGLAAVYGIIKQNGGFISVWSEPGKGTRFEICLPRITHTAGKVTGGDAGVPVPPGRPTVMIVEDEPSLLKLTSMMLEKQGYRILAAHAPGESIRLAKEHGAEIHLLITDVMMPGMNGLDLARTLQDLHPGLKCLFMSGFTADVISQHDSLLDESVHFIQKPFSGKNFADKVRETLGAIR